jgi:hypothetical protein
LEEGVGKLRKIWVNAVEMDSREILKEKTGKENL